MRKSKIMKMTKKSWRSLGMLALASALLNGCSSPSSPTEALGQFLSFKGMNMISIDTATPVVSDASHQGASVEIRLRLPVENKGFQTQVAKTVAGDLQSFNVYLLSDNSSTPTPVAGPIAVNKDPGALPGNGSTQTIRFTDVVAGTYYAGVMAYDGLNGTGNNITHTGGSCTISAENCYITNGGGNAGTGSVTVGGPPNYPITPTHETPLTVFMQLCNC